MSRSVFCDEKYLERLKEITCTSGFTPGLIIGQSSRGKDYITLLAPTPNFSELDVDSLPSHGSFKVLKDFDDKWIAAHATSIKHSLTGGMNILGVFLVDNCSEDSSGQSEAFSKLRVFTSHLALSSKTVPYYKSYISSNPLVLYFSTASNKIICKSLTGGALSGSLEAVKVNLMGPEAGWLPVECTLGLSLMDPFHVPPITQDLKSLRNLLKDVYQRVEGVVKDAAVAVEGCFISPAQLDGDVGSAGVGEWVEEVRKASAIATKTRPTEGPAQVSLYAPFAGISDGMSGDDASKVTFYERDLEKDTWNIVRPHGSLAARISVCATTPLQEVVQNIKEDLLRCLSSKLDLYITACDGALPKSDKDGVWRHDLPRRIVLGVEGVAVELAEYVVGEEGPVEAAESLSAILAIPVHADDVRCSDPTLLQAAAAANASALKGKNSEKAVTGRVQNRTMIAFIVLSAIVLIASIIIHFIVK